MLATMAQAESKNAMSAADARSSEKGCLYGTVTVRDSDRMFVCNKAGSWVPISSPFDNVAETNAISLESRRFGFAGASDLRPIGVTNTTGQTRFLFAKGTNLPVPYTLGDDGRLSPVSFTVRPKPDGSELVFVAQGHTVILRSEDREAIVQLHNECRVDGVAVAGAAEIRCLD